MFGTNNEAGCTAEREHMSLARVRVQQFTVGSAAFDLFPD